MDTRTITIIRTSQRGALLITDGSRVAWVMGRTRRADGSFTPSAVRALAEGTPYETWEAENNAREARRAESRVAREEEYQKGKETITVDIGAYRLDNGTSKAWRVRTDEMQRLYGKTVHVYQYLPKSVVAVNVEGNTAYLTMPRWFLAKSGWLKELI